MKLAKQTEAEILEVYLNFWEVNLAGDIKGFASYMLDSFSIFGTANGEVFYGKDIAMDFYKATVDQLAGKVRLRNRDISLQELATDTVLVREQADVYALIQDEWTFYGHARVSCILKHTGEGWKGVHQHASFPDHRTEEGQQIAAEKIAKENLELREAVKRRTVELEHKNRELEIEAAVEKVRAQSLAMHQTNDLAKVNEELFAQLTKLNIEGFTGVAIYLVDEDEMVTVWDLSSPGSMGDATGYAFKYDPKKCTVLGEFVPVWRAAQQDYFILDYPKGRLLLGAEELEPFYPAMAESFRTAINSGALQHQWNATARIANGVLSLDMMKPPTEEVKPITLKMAAAFNLAYQRFLDLQKAEAQARESQIQLALERVRARTMAMQKSEELLDVISIFSDQLMKLNISFDNVSFGVDEQGEDFKFWFATAGQSHPVLLHIPYINNPAQIRAIEAQKKGLEFFADTLTRDENKQWIQHILDHSEFRSLPDKVKNYLLSSEGYARSAFILKNINLYIGNYKNIPYTEEENSIFKKFAQTFEQSYTRFLDLQKAEAQTLKAEQDLVEIMAARKKAEETLTELQSTQKQLIQSEKMASLGELTAGIAHEIQNPLNFVNNFSDVSKELLDEMREELEKGNVEQASAIAGDVIQNLEKILHHGKRAGDIVKGMLQHSRTGSGQKEPADINALVDEYLRLAYHGWRAKDKAFNATTKTDFDESIGMIKIIPQDIGRVILNLLTNAFYAVTEAKKINEVEYEPTVTVSTKKNKDAVEIRVNDNGNGIPRHILDKIFQPFFTTKPTGQGTGLGLSLSYDIVKAHGGELKVETKDEKGTQFTILIPFGH